MRICLYRHEYSLYLFRQKSFHSFKDSISIQCQTTRMDDPRQVEERNRRKNGIFRRLGIPRSALPHPSLGGTRGYSVAMRQSEIWAYEQGLPTVASTRSIQRWYNRLNPFIMTGNRQRDVIVGRDQYNLQSGDILACLT